jgi:hypothetical protein
MIEPIQKLVKTVVLEVFSRVVVEKWVVVLNAGFMVNDGPEAD